MVQTEQYLDWIRVELIPKYTYVLALELVYIYVFTKFEILTLTYTQVINYKPKRRLVLLA